MLRTHRVGSTQNLHPTGDQMAGTPGPVSGFSYLYFMVYYIFSIAPPRMRLQVEARARTQPEIIACSLVEKCSVKRAEQRYKYKHLPQTPTLKEPGVNDDKD